MTARTVRECPSTSSVVGPVPRRWIRSPPAARQPPAIAGQLHVVEIDRPGFFPGPGPWSPAARLLVSSAQASSMAPFEIVAEAEIAGHLKTCCAAVMPTSSIGGTDALDAGGRRVRRRAPSQEERHELTIPALTKQQALGSSRITEALGTRCGRLHEMIRGTAPDLA